MRRVAAMALLLSWIQAAQLPDPEKLLKQVDDAYRSFRTLQYEWESTIHQPGQSNPDRRPTTTKGRYITANPGKRREESITPRGTFISVWDGRTEWHYNPVRNEYTRTVAAVDKPDAPPAGTGSPGPRESHRTLRQELLEIDGKKYDCWVVETRRTTLPGADSGKYDPETETTEEEVTTQWIDKKLLVERQSIQSIKSKTAGKVTEFLATLVRKNFKINQPVADSTFTFVPPPDAKEVKELFGRSNPSADLVGKEAPDFQVKGVDGKMYTLASFRDKPVLLDFWASWCEPCRESMPAMEKIYADYKNQGLVILGVNSKEDLKTVKSFLKRTRFPYPAVLSGGSGIREAYDVDRIPTFVLIGRNGRILAQQVGFTDESQIRSMLESVGLKAPLKSQ